MLTPNSQAKILVPFFLASLPHFLIIYIPVIYLSWSRRRSIPTYIAYNRRRRGIHYFHHNKRGAWRDWVQPLHIQSIWIPPCSRSIHQPDACVWNRRHIWDHARKSRKLHKLLHVTATWHTETSSSLKHGIKLPANYVAKIYTKHSCSSGLELGPIVKLLQYLNKYTFQSSETFKT